MEEISKTIENNLSTANFHESLDSIHPNVLNNGSLVNVPVNVINISSEILEIHSYSNIRLDTPNTGFIVSSNDDMYNNVFVDSVFMVENSVSKNSAAGSLRVDLQDHGRVNLNKSENIKQMLENLSDILNSTQPSEQQKSEGRLILNSLADMINSSVCVESDDSGHSSVQNKSLEKEEEYSPKPAVKLNKSVNTKTQANKSFLPVSQHITSYKIRSKSAGCDAKKGPLKVVIPVEKIKKSSSLNPRKVDNKKNTIHSVKASTPINTRKFGFATSTPIDSPIPATPSRKLKAIRASSVNTTDKKTRHNSETSTSILKKLGNDGVPANKSIPIRRNSISGDKILKPNTSLRYESGIMLGLRKFRENYLKTSNSDLITKIFGNCNVPVSDKKDFNNKSS